MAKKEPTPEPEAQSDDREEQGDGQWVSEVDQRFANLEADVANLKELAQELISNLPHFAMLGVPKRLQAKFEK